MIYRCHFLFHGARTHVDVCNGCGIWDFKGGFWLNEKMEFTKLSDNVYWVPPAAVTLIEKIR